MKREVWVSEEVDISLWAQDASGGIIAPAIRELDFAQGVSVKPVLWQSTREEPGVSHQQHRSKVIGYEIDTGELFSRDAEQMAPFLTGGTYRILMRLVNPWYPGVAPLENDTLDFRGCTLKDGPTLSWQDDTNIEVGLSFFAETKV